MQPHYTSEQLSGLVGKIYKAASSRGEWHSVLESVAHATGSSSACMPVQQPGLYSEETLNYRVPGELQHEYREILQGMDRVSTYARRQDGFIGTTSSLFRKKPDLYVPEFEERMGHYGQAERWGANLTPTTALSLHRETSLGNYSDRDKNFLAQLVPHLGSAADIFERLQHTRSERDELLECIGNLGLAMLLLNDKGDILMTNGMAERVIRDYAELDIQQARLQCTVNGQDRALTKAMEQVITGSQAQGCLRVATGNGGLEIKISPFLCARRQAGNNTMASARYAVFIAEPGESTDIDTGTLRELYGLTETETETLDLLANDFSVSEIARLRQVTQATVRTQVQVLREKTGCSRQSSLVRLALNGVARLGRMRCEAASARLKH